MKVFAANLESFIQNKELRKPYYKGDYPAATWVEVKRLYARDFSVEVEIIAVLNR